MPRTFDHRAGHYLLLAAVWALGCLPNLGGPTLWDIDEGLNAEASREMLASGNFVVPTFNYQLRSAKPVLLYWLQAACYRLLGVHETAARLPSALAALLAVLAVYELGRLMFTRHAALLAGVILATTAGVLGAGHFANPDALLLAFTAWSLGLYYRFWRTNSSWALYASAAACGLAVLAKGPVGLLLPGAVVVAFLLWQKQPRRLFDTRLAEAFVIFLVVAAPWYVWVAVETKGQFLREFWGGQHLRRVTEVMEKHDGWPGYYAVALAVGLLPWSAFLVQAARNTWQEVRNEAGRDAVRFLLAWFAVWFVAFSIARTKLPNYVLPIYPAAALLLGRALDRWRRSAQNDKQERHRGAALVWVAASATVFYALVAALALPALNAHKPPRLLAAALPADHEYREVRLATHGYDRPSLVFYCRREMRKFDDEAAAVEFLNAPEPAYLIVPEARWREMAGKAGGARVLACHPDVYARGAGVVVVANGAAHTLKGVDQRARNDRLAPPHP